MMGFICASVLLMHPFHTTTAEMEWNAETSRFEVSLKMQSVDVQRILSERSKAADAKSLDAMTQEELGKVIAEYLRTRMRLETIGKDFKRPATGKLKWIGIEERGASFWFYFELIPPDGPRPWRLYHAVLHQFEQDQVNTVTFRCDQPLSLNFNPRSATQVLPDQVYQPPTLAPSPKVAP